MSQTTNILTASGENRTQKVNLLTQIEGGNIRTTIGFLNLQIKQSSWPQKSFSSAILAPLASFE